MKKYEEFGEIKVTELVEAFALNEGTTNTYNTNDSYGSEGNGWNYVMDSSYNFS